MAKVTSRPSIDARAVWSGDALECRVLYAQFINDFGGSFKAIRSYYGWKREPMIRALRQGKIDVEARNRETAKELAAKYGY